MEQVTAFLDKIRTQLATFWGGLTTAKKAIFGGAVALGLVLIVFLVSVSSVGSKSYLYQGLGSDDLSAISAELKKSGNIDYTIDNKGILVDEAQVIPLRLKLAQEGLPAHGQIGWEKFDQQDFTRTEFEQRIHRLRATQGELARTINSIEGITSSRVHIVMPKESLFVEDQEEPTAAVYVNATRGAEISQKVIKGIVHLVGRSVEGLNPENITIIDQEGKMLTEIESKDPTAKMTKEILAYRRSLEKDLVNRIRTIVGRVVGPDRVEAKVDVQVDFTKEEQTLSDIDPDRVTVLSSNTLNQKMAGNGLNPTGIPGAKSNVPGEQEELTVGQSTANSEKNSERLNYEIARKQSHRVLPVGSIQRISAAVLVDGKQPYPVDGSQPKFEPRTVEEMSKIEELVKSAIGFNEKRDDVKVHNMLFQLDPYQIQTISERKKENRQYISTLALSSVIALALVFFFAFIVRPYFRWLSYDPERKKAESLIEEFKPDLELGGIQNVQVKEDVPFDKLSPHEQVLYLAKHEPARTTEALRILLNPHANT